MHLQVLIDGLSNFIYQLQREKIATSATLVYWFLFSVTFDTIKAS